MLQEIRPDPLTLPFPGHHDPVEVPGPFRAGRRAPARVPDQLTSGEGPGEPVVLIAVQMLVQELDRGGDLLLAEEAGLPGQPLKSFAMSATDGAERAIHGPPWPPEPHAVPPRPLGAPARRSPTPRPWPCVTARPRRSDRDWGSPRAPRGARCRPPACRPARSPSPAWSATPSPRRGPTGPPGAVRWGPEPSAGSPPLPPNRSATWRHR